VAGRAKRKVNIPLWARKGQGMEYRSYRTCRRESLSSQGGSPHLYGLHGESHSISVPGPPKAYLSVAMRGNQGLPWQEKKKGAAGFSLAPERKKKGRMGDHPEGEGKNSHNDLVYRRKVGKICEVVRPEGKKEGGAILCDRRRKTPRRR